MTCDDFLLDLPSWERCFGSMAVVPAQGRGRMVKFQGLILLSHFLVYSSTQLFFQAKLNHFRVALLHLI